ncbi:TPA: hypothetical protein ACPSKY_000706 [Legionella bozemanae]
MTEKSLAQEIQGHQEKSRIDFEYKFKLFICGLIFAVLSLAVQHPVESHSVLLKILEIFSWLFLLLSGYFSLVWVGNFHIHFISQGFEKFRQVFKRKWSPEILMWRLFYISLFLLVMVKGMTNFSQSESDNKKNLENKPMIINECNLF